MWNRVSVSYLGLTWLGLSLVSIVLVRVSNWSMWVDVVGADLVRLSLVNS